MTKTLYNVRTDRFELLRHPRQGKEAQLQSMWWSRSRAPGALALAGLVALSCLQAAGAAEDTRLGPNPVKAEKAVAQALRSTYEDEHGNEIPPALIYKNYDCTKTVDVLPPRMSIHSDSCSLWRKSGHVEDE